MTKISLLLTTSSNCLRWQIMKDLPYYSSEELELVRISRYQDPLLLSLLKFQNEDGSFRTDKLTATSSFIQATSIALVKLSFLGFDNSFLPAKMAAEYLFKVQQPDGSWLYHATNVDDGEQYDMVPLQTAFPTWGLASIGYASDSRLEKSYEWLFSIQLKDGTWPVGIVSGNFGYIAGYRKLPNSLYGCRVNTTCCLLAFSLHSVLKYDYRVLKALNIFLEKSIKEKSSLGTNIAKYIGVEPSSGYFSYFSRHDPEIVTKIVSRINVLHDRRVTKLCIFLNKMKNELGLWECYKSPIASYWLTYSLYKSIKRITINPDLLRLEPDIF